MADVGADVNQYLTGPQLAAKKAQFVVFGIIGVDQSRRDNAIRISSEIHRVRKLQISGCADRALLKLPPESSDHLADPFATVPRVVPHRASYQSYAHGVSRDALSPGAAASIFLSHRLRAGWRLL